MNKLQTHIYPSVAEALEAAVSEMAGKPFSLDSKKYFIVPDKITLTSERMLSAKLGGVMDIQIVTFNTLVRKYVLPFAQVLSEQGSVMLIKRILEEKKSELKCFKRSALTKGFAGKMYDTIASLAFDEVKPEDFVLKTGNTKQDDIRLIYREYTEKVKEFMPDAAERMVLLKKHIEETDMFEGADVIFAGFDTMLQNEKSVMNAIVEKAASVAEFRSKRTKTSFKKVVLTESDSMVNTAKSIAAGIACLIKVNKVSPDEICVLTADENPYELRRIFDENGIPYTASEPLRLSMHPLGDFIALALRVPERGFKAREVINIAKCAYTGTDTDGAADFERYVQKFGVSYKGFFSPFDKESDFTAGAERTRQRIVPIIKDSGADIPERLRKLIETAAKNSGGAVMSESEGRADPIKRLNEILALAETLLRGLSPKAAEDAIIEAMETTELSSRPKYSGAVDIGTEDELKAKKYKYVFVSDFSGDNHPAVTHDEGLLSDDDIAALKKNHEGSMLTSVEANKRNKDTFYGILGNAAEVRMYYTESCGRCAPEIEIMSQSFERATGFNSVGGKGYVTPEEFLSLCPTENMLLERYLMDLETFGDNPPSYLEFAKSVVKDRIPSIEKTPDELEGLGNIMVSDHVAPSSVEMYFCCPRRYYCGQVLRLKRVEKADMDSTSVGNIIHRVAELYLADLKDPEEVVPGLLQIAVEESGKVIKDYDLAILLSEAMDLCKEILRQSTIGSFVPYGAEMEFGKNEDSPLSGIELNVGDRKINLIGKIDRIDTAETDAGTLVRIFDYKTGKADFKKVDLEEGRKLQLPLYLAAAESIGRPAAAFYFPTRKIGGEYKLKTVMDTSLEVLAAMDSPDEKLIEIKYTKNGKPSANGNAGKVLTDEEGMKAIIDEAKKLTESAAVEISGGFIKPSPYETKICKRCDYRQCCEYSGSGRSKKEEEND